MAEVDQHLTTLEKKMGRTLGDPGDPLLVSVRSGSMFSMPGMMDTVLNLGMNDESVEGLAKQTDDDRFAWDSYRRFIQMFGKTVMGLSGELFEDALDEAKLKRGKKMKTKAADVKDTDLTADDLRARRRRVQGDRQGRDEDVLPAGSDAAAAACRSRPSSTRGTTAARRSTAGAKASTTRSARR